MQLSWEEWGKGVHVCKGCGRRAGKKASKKAITSALQCTSQFDSSCSLAVSSPSSPFVTRENVCLKSAVHFALPGDQKNVELPPPYRPRPTARCPRQKAESCWPTRTKVTALEGVKPEGGIRMHPQQGWDSTARNCLKSATLS